MFNVKRNVPLCFYKLVPVKRAGPESEEQSSAAVIVVQRLTGEEGLETGLPKSPPALHDPRSRGPIAVVRQFHLAGGEAVIRQPVLPVKSICKEKKKQFV